MKRIKGFEGLYKISKDGNIYSFKNNRRGISDKYKILKPIKRPYYYTITLFKNNIQYKKFIHRLVAEHFIQKIEGKNIVNHKNGNKLDNRVENLERVNKSEDVKHSYNILGHKKYQLGLRGKQSINKIKLVEQIDLYGNTINIYYGFNEAGRILNTSAGNIRRACLYGYTCVGYKFKSN